MTMKSAPSLDSQIETLRVLLRLDWRGPNMRKSELQEHRENLWAVINTLMAEKERRMSTQEALDRLQREP